MKKISLMLTLLLCLAAACAAPQRPATPPTTEPTPATEPAPPTTEPAGAYTFTDALGTVVTVDNPQRVACLMGGFAQTWNLAGGSDLIAVTDDAFEDRDINLPEDVTSVGKFTSPNVEILIGLDPDLVILSSETPAHVALQHTLTEAGITTAYFNVTHFEDYLEMLRVLTDITGRSDLYAQNGTTVQTRIEEIIAETAARAYSPNIAFLITYSGGAAVQDKHTMTGKMLLELGCVNITDENPSLLSTFSMESLIAYDPDYIFIVPMGNDDELTHKNLEEIIESHPAWKDLSAVVNGHYILLPHDLFLYKPNARWAESYAYLADLLQESGDSSFGALDI